MIQSRLASFGMGVPVSQINTAKTGKATAKRNAVAVNGGTPEAMILLAITVLPTVSIASAR
jgi:hypothetical protein